MPLAERQPVAIGGRGITPETMDDLYRFAVAVSKSGLAPKGIETPEAIFVALEMGLEVGLPLMASLQNIAVINGRPTIWGDAQLAVVRGTGQLEVLEEWYEEKGKRLPRNPSTFTDDTVAICRVKRAGYEAAETGFGVADAKRAGLWGKQGPWSQYPARMLRFRARSFALRDQFGDALRGQRTTEEVMDDPVQAAVNVTPKAPKPRFLTEAPAETRAEAHEFDAGGDPVAPAPTPTAPADTAPAVAVSPQAELAGIITGAGFTLDDLNKFAIAQEETAAEFASFDDIPTALAAKWVRARVGLVAGLGKQKGGGL